MVGGGLADACRGRVAASFGETNFVSPVSGLYSLKKKKEKKKPKKKPTYVFTIPPIIHPRSGPPSIVPWITSLLGPNSKRRRNWASFPDHRPTVKIGAKADPHRPIANRCVKLRSTGCVPAACLAMNGAATTVAADYIMRPAIVSAIFHLCKFLLCRIAVAV